MKNLNWKPLVLIAFLLNGASTWAEPSSGSIRSDRIERAHAKALASSKIFRNFTQGTQDGIPDSLLKNASCVAVFSEVVKAAFVFGGRGGWGLLSCRQSDGAWSQPLFLRLGGLSGGFQIGIQKLDLVLIFTDPDAMKRILQSNFTLGAGVGLTAGPRGRGLEAGTDFRLDGTVYSYSKSRGLFAGVNLEGSVVSPYDEYNQAVYPEESNSQVMTNTTAHNCTTEIFVSTLNEIAGF